MKRVFFALLAAAVVSSSTGCCCLDRLFCWGCHGGCGGGGCGGGGWGDSCGGGCDSCGGGGCSDCGGGGYSGGPYGNADGFAQQGGGGGGYGSGMANAGGAPMAHRKPAQGHPLVQQRRNAGGEYEFAAGPPSGGTTYPYYTNRGPRDYLARNPRSIGP